MRAGTASRSHIAMTAKTRQTGKTSTTSVVDLVDFLRDVAPYSDPVTVSGFVQTEGAGLTNFVTADISLHCSSDVCDGERMFALTTSVVIRPSKQWKDISLSYRCLNCRATTHDYYLKVLRPSANTESPIELIKIGEYPEFGISVDEGIAERLGRFDYLLRQGARAESAGLGLGAFTYYRHTVEKLRRKIFSEMLSILKKRGADKKVLTELRAARSAVSFKAAMDKLSSDGLTPFLIGGVDPLKVLLEATSFRVYNKSDAECLRMARDLRLVLGELIANLEHLSAERKELNSAINRLMKSTQAGGVVSASSKR